MPFSRAYHARVMIRQREDCSVSFSLPTEMVHNLMMQRSISELRTFPIRLTVEHSE